MYLREYLIENVEPIDFIDITFPFNQDGTPKPLVLVGVAKIFRFPILIKSKEIFKYEL